MVILQCATYLTLYPPPGISARARSAPRYLFRPPPCKEYGGEFPEDVRDGTEQQVYWVDGTTIVRSRVNGTWVYSVEEDLPNTDAASSVHGGVLSSDEPDGAPVRDPVSRS